MQCRGNLAILGGDERLTFAARRLETLGWKTRSWGRGEGAHGWEWALEGADAILLPLPASADGVRVSCPRFPDASLRFDVLLSRLSPKTVILGGRIPNAWQDAARSRQILLEDYCDSDLFQLRNALPTAEGALFLALETLPVTLDGCEVAVIGYGRIASLLAEKLNALGAHVTVWARKNRDLAHARLRHLNASCLIDEGASSSLCGIPSSCRMIFNTVPTRLLTEPVLQCLPRECILMELASAPGGFDPLAAERLGMKWVLASALPGRFFPESAGQILGDHADERLSALLSAPSDDIKGRNESC